MSTNSINENELILKCSETSWRGVSIHKMAEGTEKRKKANDLGYKAVKLILELLRLKKSEIAIEIGMTAIQMFSDGHNYHQVISCIEGLREPFEDSRLIEDVFEYETSAKKEIKNSNVDKKENKIDILYSLVWENGCLGTSDAIKFYKERTNSPISEPTIILYCRILKSEQRIISIGGPTGRPIEMYPNNSISLNRKSSYAKVNFFEGNLRPSSKLFEPIWDAPFRKNSFVYEVQNGNDPRIFALIEPGESIPPRLKEYKGISKMPSKVGVEGKLHPVSIMPKYGFRLIENINDADFLSDCRIQKVLEA